MRGRSQATAGNEPIELRPIEAADAPEVARIVFDAFAGIHDRHRFARDFPTPEAAAGLVGALVSHPAIWGVVAESGGRLVGSNFLDERGPVRGVGPITVDPGAQARGVGRRLMQAVIDRGDGAAGIRLLQDSFNTASLSLYTVLGFDPRDPVAVIGGRPAHAATTDLEVRPLVEADLGECEALHVRVHGFERSAELRDSLASDALQPVVGIRDGRIAAYAAGVTFFPAAHGVAESERDLADLILGALAQTGADASFLLPVRQAEAFRVFLGAGLRVVKPMTYMTMGEHREPAGAWFPSVLY